MSRSDRARSQMARQSLERMQLDPIQVRDGATYQVCMAYQSLDEDVVAFRGL